MTLQELIEVLQALSKSALTATVENGRDFDVAYDRGGVWLFPPDDKNDDFGDDDQDD